MSVDAHVSRCYQDELAERAKTGNAILAMDTGTGKTMISAMVIKWMLTQERMNRGNDRSLATKRVSHGHRQQRDRLGLTSMTGRNISRP
jgi:endoribonuclease Dicer